MGWEALARWGDDVARIERLAGGVANEVWSVRLDGRLAVARRGRRSDADLAWETELLVRLDREGLTVPVPIPTMDGRLFADGVVVMGRRLRLVLQPAYTLRSAKARRQLVTSCSKNTRLSAGVSIRAAISALTILARTSNSEADESPTARRAWKQAQ